jgi:hypothetical protein
MPPPTPLINAIGAPLPVEGGPPGGGTYELLSDDVYKLLSVQQELLSDDE